MAPRKSGLQRATSRKSEKRKHGSQAVPEVSEGSNASLDAELAPPAPLKKRGRGPSIMRKSTDTVEDRPIIWPIGPREFTCNNNPNQIKTAITRLALQNMPAPLRSFLAYDETTKNNIEFLFLKKFRYKEGEDPDHCRDVFEAIATKRVSEELHEARDRCIRKFGPHKELWKAAVLHWCLNHPNWHGLCDLFFTQDWQAISGQNHANRLKRGRTAHHGGSASSHQHHQMLTKLQNGKEPSKIQLYAHIHCRKVNGKSSVVAQIKAAMQPVSGTEGDNENNDDNGLRDSITENRCTEIPDLDINSLHFTNTDSHDIYQKVKDMMADQANSHMDESSIFLSAVGGSKHGRVRGLGSMLPNKGQPATSRGRQNHTASSVSGVIDNGEQATFCRAEVGMLLSQCERRQDEEKAERERKLETFDLYFDKLFSMYGIQKPTLQAQANNSGTEQGVLGILPTIQAQANNSGIEQGVLGILPTIQAPPNNSGAKQGVTRNLTNFQGLPFPMQPNHGGSFQALLNQAPLGNDAIARGDEWWGNLALN